MRFTRKPGALIGALVFGLTLSVPAQANHNEDDHSDNVKHLAQLPMTDRVVIIRRPVLRIGKRRQHRNDRDGKTNAKHGTCP